MPGFSFSKLIPGGNPTIILHNPGLPPAGLAELSSQLMQPMHIGAEQVGALVYTDALQKTILPRLRMMGGEFCINATRAAALLLARQGRLAGLSPCCAGMPVWGGSIVVTGMEQPVTILVSPDREALLHAARFASIALSGGRPGVDGEPCDGPQEALLHCAACVDCSMPGTSCLSLGAGVSLVRMPGISHLLIDTAVHALPDLEGGGWKDSSSRRRSQYGLANAPASGVIWFRREKTAFRIWPAVEVTATRSEHLETACGSASLALALRAWQQQGAGPVDVLQPSGETLQVFPAANPGQAWISGPVALVAEGTAYA